MAKQRSSRRNLAKPVTALDFSDPNVVDEFKEQVNLIYKGFRERKLLMPHSVFLPKEELLKALGVARREEGLVETSTARAGVLLYVASNVNENDPDEMVKKLFPDEGTQIDPNENSSYFTIAVIATNSRLETYQAAGANFIATKECPPADDCPPWHSAPLI